MVDWQSESDLDSIRNSCDVYSCTWDQHRLILGLQTHKPTVEHNTGPLCFFRLLESGVTNTYFLTCKPPPWCQPMWSDRNIECPDIASLGPRFPEQWITFQVSCLESLTMEVIFVSYGQSDIRCNHISRVWLLHFTCLDYVGDNPQRNKKWKQ